MGDPKQEVWFRRYWNKHVDKANRHAYDYSAILYLNSHCDATRGDACDYNVDFAGGGLSFLDDKSDLTVEPVAGRLLTFTGGLENLHTVREVTKGTRAVLALWFTCSYEDRYVDTEASDDKLGQALPHTPTIAARTSLEPAVWPDPARSLSILCREIYNAT